MKKIEKQIIIAQPPPLNILQASVKNSNGVWHIGQRWK